MYILGINSDHNSSAALLKDGKVIACVSEERFNRIKNYYGIPEKSIDYCLKFAKIDPSELDLVVVASEVPPPLPSWGFINNNKKDVYKFLKYIHQFLIEEVEWRFPFFRKVDEVGYSAVSFMLKGEIKKDRIKRLKERLNVDDNKIVFIDHHLCHALTSLYGAPFLKDGIKDILVFTADAEGDGLAATVSIYKDGQLKRIAKTSQNNSIGNFYSAITQYLGMKPGEHEYKVMGLAPYAPSDFEKVFKKIEDWIKVDRKNLRFETKVNAHTFVKLCNKQLKEIRFDLIAAAAQKLLEERIVEWIEEAMNKTRINNVVVGGGVFMNVKVNKLLNSNKRISNFFVFPSCGDESNAFGAAFFGYKKISENIPEPIKDLYLGPEFDDNYIEKILKKMKGFKVLKYKDIEYQVAKLLSKGEIIARFSGKAEWGARALGNRSLLSDPSRPETVEVINKMIKSRDFWMPFAPIILNEVKDKYLFNSNRGNGYYMMLAYDTRENKRSDLVAAIHPYDKTARAQILAEGFNPNLWKLLNDFLSFTGKGVLLNTSFNIHGEPIVGSPEDALDVLKRSGLEYLALGSYLIYKT